MVGSIVGGGKAASATRDAANTQAAAANNATALQKQQFDQVSRNTAPYVFAGQGAVNQLAAAMPTMTQAWDPSMSGLQSQFQFDPNSINQDPAFQTAMTQGTAALDRSANARGGVMGGAQAKALTQFGQQTANSFINDDYQRAFNTYQANYQNAMNTFNTGQDRSFNKWAGLAQIGLGGNGQINQAGQAYANNAGETGMQAANAQAMGLLGGANAFNATAGQVGGDLSKMFGSSTLAGIKSLFGGGTNKSNGSSYDMTSND
jgi:hypothetical protein